MPRAVIRKSFEVDYIEEDDCETLLDALDKRNLLSHTYWSDVAREAEALIKETSPFKVHVTSEAPPQTNKHVG